MDSFGCVPLPTKPHPLVAVMAWTKRHWHVCRWCFLAAGFAVGATTDHFLFDMAMRVARACWGTK